MVFGDIGTSPLYTFNSIYTELHAIPGQDDMRQGFSATWWPLMTLIPLPPATDDPPKRAKRPRVALLEVIFWTLTWMICFKYVGLVMRVSHHGEGGTFAMMKVILETLREREDSESDSDEDRLEEVSVEL